MQVIQKDMGFMLSVIDEGVGMTDEQIQKIATQKIITSTRGTAKEKGSGLGLMLCREFVEIHGGNMEITSDNLFPKSEQRDIAFLHKMFGYTSIKNLT